MSRKKVRGKGPGQYYRKVTDPPSGAQRRALFALSKTAETQGRTEWVAKIGNPYSPSMTFGEAQGLLNDWRAEFPEESKAYQERRRELGAIMSGRTTTPPSILHGGVITFAGSQPQSFDQLKELVSTLVTEKSQIVKAAQEVHTALAIEAGKLSRVAAILEEELSAPAA